MKIKPSENRVTNFKVGNALLAVMSVIIAILIVALIKASGEKVVVIEKVEPEVIEVEVEAPEIVWEIDNTFNALDVPMDTEMQEYIFEQCEENGIDFAFVMAQIKQESSFRPNVISPTNDYGLMQINKMNHGWLSKELGITDFLDARQNVRAGMYILRGLFEKYEDPAMVLMAYNMGEPGAKKLWNKGIYTTSYVENIEKYQSEFINELEGGAYVSE